MAETPLEQAVRILAERKLKDPLANYVPGEAQGRCLVSKKMVRMLQGSNRCLAGEQTIYDPVANRHRRVDSIDGPFHVYAYDEKTGSIVVAEAEKPFTKPAMLLHEITLSNGRSFRATLTHRVLQLDGTWTSLDCLPPSGGIHLRSISDTCLSALREGAQHCWKKHEDSQVGYRHESRLCDPLPHAAQDSGPSALPSPVGVLEHNDHGHPTHEDVLQHTPGYSHFCQLSGHPSTQDAQPPAEDQPHRSLGLECGRDLQSVSSTCLAEPQLCSSVGVAPQSDHASALEGCRKCECVWNPCLVASNEAVSVKGITALRTDTVWDFTVPIFHSYVEAGIVHHNSGKTSHMVVEFCLAARRLHPTRTTDKPVTFVLWANSREQIRDVLYQKMRVHSELKGTCSEEPMIPDHEVIKDHMTNGAGKPVCREIALKNGNKILFAISGIDRSWQQLQGKGYIAGIGVDEQAGSQKLIDECMARLMELNNADNIAEFGGAWFMWASSETLINDAWDSLKSICLDPDKNKDAEYFHIKASENHAVTHEARERVGQFMSETAYKIRISGEGNARAATLVYGRQFSDARHMLAKDHVPSEKANLWVGYDPGVGHETAMSIFCLEPENPMQLIGVKFFLWKGGTIDSDVMHLAKWLAGRKLAGFSYDINLRNRDRGGGPTVLDQMKEKMEKIGITPTGGYWQARKQVNAGIQMVRHYLDPAPDNRSATPLLMFNPSEESGGKLMRWQLLKYAGHEERKFTGAGAIIKKDDDLADSLRYICMQRPAWARDFTCGIGNTAYVYPSQFEEKTEDPEVLTPDQTHMRRLMELSKVGAALRSGHRRRR